MTIAAGFVCRDGIVMCADTQESSGDFKWPVRKLAIPQSMMSDTRLMISGAGFGVGIDTATQKIFNRVCMSQMGYEECLATIEHVLREIHERDLPTHPFAGSEGTAFQLLIAMRMHDGSGLFRTSGSLVKRVDFFEVLGSGAVTNFFAHLLYRKTRWDTPILKMSEGTVLAAYLAHLAKRQLSSVGGQTQIATLSWEGEFNIAQHWEVPQWESVFADTQRMCGDLMLDLVDPSSSSEDFASRLDGFALTLKAVKSSLIKDRAELLEMWAPVDAATKERRNVSGAESDKISE